MDRIGDIKRAALRGRLSTAVLEDRVMAHVDGAALETRLVLERLRADFGRMLGPAGGRRASDRPAADGLTVSEVTGFRGVQLGNADIARSERAAPSPDLLTNTLPIYPKPADLPEGGAA